MSRGYVSLSTLAYWAGGLYISSVDFGCFSTWYGDCEALDEREEQVTFTLLLRILLTLKRYFIMKKILLVLFTIVTQYETLSATVTIAGHTSLGKYNECSVFVVKSNETLKFGLSQAPSSAIWEYCYIDDEYIGSLSSELDAYDSNQLVPEILHKFKLQKYYKALGQEAKRYVSTCYVIINSTSKTVCSKTKCTITIWHGDASRWERSYDGGSTWTNIACTTYQYTESNPTAGTAKYRVLGTDNTYSDVVTITYVDAVPSTIQATPATNTKTVDESITLTANVTDNGYKYQWKKNGTDISGATKRTYTISTIKSSHAGNYTCYVSNGCNGITTATAKLTVNKCAQTINFPEIPTQTYSSGLTYTLPKTTNKGLTITYQSMNTSVATVSGNVLTIKAPGTAIISASQAGNSDYLEATQVSRTLTVNKRSQVITFNELPEKTYEDLPFTLPQKTNEGLTISYSSTNTSVATVSGNTVTILKPGTTDIIASQAGDATHYAAAEVSQTLVVKKAAQEITFGSLSSKTYGDAPFELNKVSNKNLTITYTSSDVSIASVSGNTVTINKPGTVTITASQTGNAYYLAAEPISRTLTINKANQTINFPALDSRAFGSADFTLPAQTDKGQVISYESSNPVVATINGNIVHITGAGTTEITASQDGNDYYNAASIISQTLTITKATQTINFPKLPACVYGQDPVTLNATVNSGLDIEYESSDYSVATIDGNQLTIVGAGQCYITASAAGNKNYYTATPVEQTLVVAKAQPTIDFASLEGEYTYGDAPIALVAKSNMGQVQFSSSNPSKLTIFGQNAIIQGAGTFTITAFTEEDANHLSASVQQEITISKANLTITANNASRTYGDKNPEFSYAYKGFVNGDTKLDLTATVQVTTDATIDSPVGTYEIAAIATNDDNYNILCKKGVLTINKAPLTITAQASREYGDNDLDYEYTYSGFVNGENSEVLTALPQAYTTAKRTSPRGTYPIVLSGASAQNYEITYGESYLYIEKALLTITAQDATRKRLEENPTFELSISGFKLEETIEVLDKLPTIQCEADINSPAGTYPIVLLNDGYAANYEYVLINGLLTVEKLQFTISVESNDETQGTVSGSGTYEEDEVIHIYATPKAHHHFVKWEDGNTDMNRTITISQNATYKAIFAIDQHSITASVNDGTKGFVSGTGKFDYGTVIELSAVPNEGYQFNRWSDGNTENPRQIEVTTNASYTAEFGIKRCVVLVKTADYEMGRVYGGGTYDYGTYIELQAEAYSGYTFSHWSNGKTYNPYTMIIKDDLNLVAYFMDDYLDEAEQTDVQFEEETPLDSVIINTTGTTAQFIWPSIDGAALYSLVIWANEEQTEKLLTLTFNASGQIVNIDFSSKAPARVRQQAMSADIVQNTALAFTVTGLENNSKYNFDMEAKNKESIIIDSTHGFFVTSASTAIDQITNDQPPITNKIIKDNQILILRGDRTYTITGQEVK